MTKPVGSAHKTKSKAQLKPILARLRAQGKKIVFTNGCFDLLHPGHVRYLEKAREFGDLLVVALNSDASVRKIKGENRPILNEEERREVVSALACVDFVTTFDDETPEEIIEDLSPDVLVKGGDWPIDRIVGRETVESGGGQVVVIKFEKDLSTSTIIERIRSRLSE